MNGLSKMAVALVIAVQAVAGFAQQYGTDTGSIMRRPQAARLDTGASNPALENARLVAALGACLASRYSMQVHRLLAAKPGSPTEMKLMRLISTSECMDSTTMRIGIDLMRGALYEGVYLRDFGRGAPPIHTTIDYAADYDNPRDSRVAPRKFADCVVRADPAGARAMLMALAASAIETARIADLRSALSACVDPTAQVTFGRATLRALLAEVAFRLAMGEGTPMTTVGKSN